MIKKLIQFIQNQKHYLSSDRYIAFLKSKGIKSETTALHFIQEAYQLMFPDLHS